MSVIWRTPVTGLPGWGREGIREGREGGREGGREEREVEEE